MWQSFQMLHGGALSFTFARCGDRRGVNRQSRAVGPGSEVSCVEIKRFSLLVVTLLFLVTGSDVGRAANNEVTAVVQ